MTEIRILTFQQHCRARQLRRNRRSRESIPSKESKICFAVQGRISTDSY
jgi:hypothetical protein